MAPFFHRLLYTTMIGFNIGNYNGFSGTSQGWRDHRKNNLLYQDQKEIIKYVLYEQ